MAAPFQNVYHRRAVAAHAAKPCFVCYKSTTTVLNQADSKDWFYTCAGHLNDRGFAIPQVDAEAEANRARKEALEKEIELVKAEYEAKLKKKAKSKDKKDGDKGKKIKDDDEPAAEEVDPEEKLKELEGKREAQGKETEGPRVFELHKSVYQMRVQKLRARLEAAQMQQRRRNPNFFPSVPKDGI